MQDLPLYDAEISEIYRYTMQDLPLYDAGFTVIRCSVSAGKIHEGDTYENLMRIIRESHETFGFAAHASKRGG